MTLLTLIYKIKIFYGKSISVILIIAMTLFLIYMLILLGSEVI